MKRWLCIVILSVAAAPALHLPAQDLAEVVPNTPPTKADIAPLAVTKRVVWNLAPKPGRTYRNLILKGGVRVAWHTVNDVTFIDCDFRDAAVLLTVQSRDDGSDNCNNWKFIRCTFVGATRDDWGHSHGAFLQGVDNFTFRDCLFKRNGWLGDERFNQNHNVYMLDVGTVRFFSCTFQRAAAQGVKALGYKRVVIDDCTFRGNLIDIGSDDRSAASQMVIRKCKFYNVGGVDSIGQTLGWSLSFEHHNNDLENVLIRRCKWFKPAVDTNLWAMKFAGGGLENAEIIGCNLRRWKVDTRIWPKVVNQIGDRLEIRSSTGIHR